MTIPNLGRGGLPVYAPVGATLSIANAAVAATFTGTAFVTTDPATGAPVYAVGVGDALVVSGVGAAIIESITDATHLVLGQPWTALSQVSITSQGTPGWYIVRNSVPSFGSVAKAINDVLARGGDDSPLVSLTIDNGGARMKFRVVSGVPEIAVGPTGTPDGSLISVLRFNTSVGSVSIGGPGATGGRRYLTANTNVFPGDYCYCDTSSGGFTLTLPASPVDGDGIAVRDAAPSWTAHTLSISRNGQMIDSALSDLVCDETGADFDLVWRGGSVGWGVVFI
jgi:hypothetical protein